MKTSKNTIPFLLGWLMIAPIASAADVAGFSEQPDQWFGSNKGRRILDRATPKTVLVEKPFDVVIVKADAAEDAVAHLENCASVIARVSRKR